MEQVKTTLGPVKNRVQVIDVLRGFAIFGILFANILSWSGYKFLPLEVLPTLDQWGIDISLYDSMIFWIDRKFYTLFCILFGVGFFIQYSKQDTAEKDRKFIAVYRRRLGILLFIGIVHSIIWSGDILTLYALMGFVFILFRKKPLKWFLPAALIVTFGSFAYDAFTIINSNPSDHHVAHLALKTYSDIAPEQVIANFQSTNIGNIFYQNLNNVKWRWIDFIPSGRPTVVLGFFFLGFYLMGIEFFSKHALKGGLVTVLLLSGILATWLGLDLGTSMYENSDSWLDILAKFLLRAGQILMALGYVGVIAIIYNTKIGQKILQPFASIGKLSMSNYLGHTALGIIVFYPFAGNLLGTVGLTEIYMIAVGILLFQLAFSKIWLHFFKFGPVEWLWRCATYKKWFPIVKTKD